ncbi:sel1 repeat family protein [Vibrio sp. Of7-15]|uniref:tetratricopeptide repeat protein n=1 Tax=Vibrio sp. Of7-15 TaxID=2724879 RepID=UPI001EF1A433|nr:tetratricopeptide repeat protein [Vibrio sp. Of7-15]MCG7499825.1 sel1 repeat family protein [Vibrio sp. Of7-15]
MKSRFMYLGRWYIGLLFWIFGSVAFANSDEVSRESAETLLKNGDYRAALMQYQQLAEEGDSLAQFTAGLFYQLGWSVKPNQTKACQWFSKAAHQKIPMAQKKVGDCIVHYSWSEEHESSPLYWYQQAFESGIYEAGCDLGRLYLDSKWKPRDIEQALYWCGLAAERQSLSAQITLGEIYEDQSEKFYDPNKARFWYQLAAERKSPIAAYKLSRLYSVFSWSDDESKVADLALYWMEKSAELRYEPAYFKTAQLYWQQLQFATEGHSFLLAKSYLWGSTAVLVSSDPESKALMHRIEQELPVRWKPDLDAKVTAFLSNN